MTIKAIETVYKGYKFRSRLEARWAVFFDALGIEYQYEPEGFEFNGIRYLPDFFLPKTNIFIEIKPKVDRYLIRKDGEKWLGFRQNIDAPLVILAGDPWPQEFDSLILVNFVNTDNEEDKGTGWLHWKYSIIFLADGVACLGIFPKKESEEVKIYPFGLALDEDAPAVFLANKNDLVLPMPAYEAARQARFEHGQIGA